MRHHQPTRPPSNLFSHRFHRIIFAFLLALLLAAPPLLLPCGAATSSTTPAAPAARPLRDELSLNGVWPQGGEVPLFLGSKLDEQTYARNVTVPKEWAGKIIRVEFEAVNYIADVFINGERLASHVGPWNRFSVDVTDHVKPGGEFSLKVVVKGMKHPPIVDDQGHACWPLGTSTYNGHLAGILDNVWLRAYGRVSIDDAFIQTSVGNKTLTVDYTLTNSDKTDRTVTLQAAVVRAGEITPEHQFNGPRVTIPAGTQTTLHMTDPWPDAQQWRPDRPTLYYLVSTLTGDKTDANPGPVIDRETRRFGFREIEIVGNQFHLNGVRYNVWGDYAVYGDTDYWPASCYTPEGFPAVIDDLKRLNVRIIRWHERPAPQFALDLADEKGLLICAETAIEHLAPINTTEFPKGCRQWIDPWIRANRNHPSIFIWSADNAMGPAGFKVLSVQDLLSFGKTIRSLDPTRPVTYDGDGDIGDAVINLHGFNPPKGSIYSAARQVNPSKPTGASEVIPVLKYFNKKNPESLEDDKWRQGYWLRGMRYCGFTDIRPSIYIWARTEMDSPRAQAVRNAYSAVAVFDKQYDDLGLNLWRDGKLPVIEAGQPLRRTLIVYNDEFQDEAVTVEVLARTADKVLAQGQKNITVPLGEHVEIDCSLTPPPSPSAPIALVLRAFKGGKLRFEEPRLFTVHGSATGSASSTIVFSEPRPIETKAAATAP